MPTIKQKLCRLSMTCAVPALLAGPAAADPAIGLGLSIRYGNDKVDTGIGVRLFSDDEEKTAVGSIGLDYMFRSGSFRGTAGVAYLGTNWYAGADLGLDFGGNGWDYGISAGGLDTDDDSSSNAPPPAPTTTTTTTTTTSSGYGG